MSGPEDNPRDDTQMTEEEWDELYGSEAHDVQVERELIREANERNARYRQLAKLREEIEQFRAAYERAKKASSHE